MLDGQCGSRSASRQQSYPFSTVFSHIIWLAPSPTSWMSNTNWLLLLCLIISAVKHNFSSPSFSQHYSPLYNLSPRFPWLSLFSPSLSLFFKLKLLHFISLLFHLASPSWWISICLTVLHLFFFYPNSYLLLSFSSLSVPLWFSYPFLHTFSYSLSDFLCWQKVKKIKGRKRWKNANLTSTHTSSLYFYFFPFLDTKFDYDFI